MPNRDELIAIAEQHAAREALHRIDEDAHDATASYRQALHNGDTAGAAMELRRIADIAQQEQLVSKFLGGGQEQEQPQQQPGQNQLTAAEVQWLQNNPGIAGDQRKMAEVIGAANALIARGYDRNSPQYLTALNIAMGNTGASAEGELTPNAVVEISKSKYGAVSADEYNRNVDALAEVKKLGLYK